MPGTLRAGMPARGELIEWAFERGHVRRAKSIWFLNSLQKAGEKAPALLDSYSDWHERPRFALFCGARLEGLAGVNARLDLVPEMPDQPLHRPCRGVAKRADSMTFNLL